MSAKATFLAFAFRISGASLAAAMALAMTIGIAGGLLPALRAARMPMAAALRDTQ